MKRILILGGDGMLGSMVAGTLRASGHVHVVATSRRQGAPTFFDADDERSIYNLIDTSGPFDYLVNCIGVLRSAIDREDSASTQRALEVNGVFPQVLARAAAASGSRVIHVSTDAVFQATAGQCDEGTPADGADAYAKSKYLGEVHSPNVLNLRCSIVGPDAATRRGLLEWFLSRKPGERVTGFVDHMWNGVTTLQLAWLVRKIFDTDGAFDHIRQESPVHHLCPNVAVTKFELLNTFRSVFGVDVRVEPAQSPDGPVTRVLTTRFRELKRLSGEGVGMTQAIEQLAMEMGRLTRR